MTTSTATETRAQPRKIELLTSGESHGPITRFLSPDATAELVKPFVLLDLVELPASGGPMFGAHPHSGIATHTTTLQGSVDYKDSTGKAGRLQPGSIEWMQAGSGVWHTSSMVPGESLQGFQLWIALPESLELEPALSQYLQPEAVPAVENARVLLGTYRSVRSPIADVSPITYLHVRLEDGETWRYEPPPSHEVAWLAVSTGKLHVSGAVVARQLVVFAAGNDAIDIRAEGRTELVLGSAAKHPHALVCGYHSVHTTPHALALGERGIRATRPGG